MNFINAYNPDLIIIDEAQRIKNWKTQTAQSVKIINSEYTIVLTGTPLENKIDELHSIVEYIDRYKLGPLFRFLHNHQLLDENGKLKGYKNLREINATLGDILLRRTKKEIIDQLPGRVDKNFFIELTKEQQTDHDSYYDTVCKLVNKWIRQGFLIEADRDRLLICLNCMRMVCDSTYILNQNTNHGNKIAELRELLDELLQNDENKIVIFSQWKKMFELVIKELEKLYIPYFYLNGDISAIQRKQIIDAFQDNPEIKIFLSTDAGGVGVNLQSANVLINLDLPWNPAVLEQRIGRIYRLGQNKHVQVFNFIARLSIEHRIFYLLDFKKSVFKGVIEEEGQDSVMLESFLESIKTLTEVNFDKKDESDGYISGNSAIKSPDFLADEHNKTVLEKYGIEKNETKDEKNQTKYVVKDKDAKSRRGVLSRIKKRVQNFFKKFKK
ncbi:MAG: DEAD/DEAH box helicase [Bacteroidales bacterium]|nr:DEAD/DEAH box helicase [Bacteroidales bacterium]